jgi:TPR repeat protein
MDARPTNKNHIQYYLQGGWYRVSAKNGFVNAYLYPFRDGGFFVPSDDRWVDLLYAANRGYPPAQEKICEFFSALPSSLNRNPKWGDKAAIMKKAVCWCRYAAKCGQPIAQVILARLQMASHCEEVFPESGLDGLSYLTKLAEGGSVDAQEALGDYYTLNGQHELAQSWYDKMPRQSDSDRPATALYRKAQMRGRAEKPTLHPNWAMYAYAREVIPNFAHGKGLEILTNKEVAAHGYIDHEKYDFWVVATTENGKRQIMGLGRNTRGFTEMLCPE